VFDFGQTGIKNDASKKRRKWGVRSEKNRKTNRPAFSPAKGGKTENVVSGGLPYRGYLIESPRILKRLKKGPEKRAKKEKKL